MPDHIIIASADTMGVGTTSVGTTSQDPDGFRYPYIESVCDDTGIGTRRISSGRTLGAVLETDRTLSPGDQVTFRCRGGDPHRRNLRWWVHPYGCERQQSVCGNNVELIWVVQPASMGRKVYVGIGMAADGRYHREGGLCDQGYDGWIVFYYRVIPAVHSNSTTTAQDTAARPYGWVESEDAWQRFVSRSNG